jgi:phospholipid N-methyltransferase
MEAPDDAAVVHQPLSTSWAQSLEATVNDLWNYLKDTGAIVWTCLRHPSKIKEVSAFSASSPWVVQTVLSHVKFGDTLEIGAGTGTITEPLLEELLKNTTHSQRIRFHVVELNSRFYETLELKIINLLTDGHYPVDIDIDADVSLYNEDFVLWQPANIAADSAYHLYDTIVSTLPITRLPLSVVKEALTKVNRLIKPGGVFIYVSLLGARSLGYLIGYIKAIFCHPEGWYKYKKKLAFIDQWLKENFDQEEVVVWRNFTPMRVYWAIKKAEVAAPAVSSSDTHKK